MPRRRRRNKRGPRWNSVRVSRTRGSGSSQTSSYRTGGLSITGLSPTGRISSPRPTIYATVRSMEGGISRRDVRLYLDGSEKSRFHYDEASGRLSYYVGNALAPGVHEVRIEAEASSSDDRGRSGSTGKKRWTFTVTRR